MTETEVVQEEDYSDFANNLKEALSTAAGNKPEEVVEEVEEVEEEAVADEVTEEEVVEDQPQEEEKEEEFKLIPKEWTKKEQESFQDALDNPDLKEAAEAFISRYESLRKDYHKKAGERADFAKRVSSIDDIFDSNAKEALRQKGMSEADYLKSLINVEKSLIANPADTIKKLAEIYKVDLKQTVSNTDDGVIDYDKTLAEMKQELADIKNEKANTKAQTAAKEEAYIAKQVKDFEFAIDDTGESKYPLFKEVKTEMGNLINEGKAKTLEEAYEMSPTVKLKRLEELKELESREDLEAEKRRVVKAKKAAKGINNKRIVTKQPVKMSLEDRLKQRFAEARASS